MAQQLVDTKKDYYRGQGTLLVAEVIDGRPGPFRKIGNLQQLEVTQKRSSEKHIETQSGMGMTDHVDYKDPEIEISFDLEKFDTKNMEMMFKGTVHQIAEKTVTGEEMPTAKAGEIWRLKGVNVSALKLVDSTSGTPKSLVEGTHFVYSPHGSVEFVDVTGFQQPFFADYKQSASVTITMLTAPEKEYWYAFEGLNCAKGLEPVGLDYYRVQTDLADKIPLINEKIASFNVKGQALADMSKPANGEYGRIGRITRMPQVA